MAELHLGALLMHCFLSFSAASTPCSFQIPSELRFCFENVHHSHPHQPPPPQYTDAQSRTDSYESWIITVVKVNQSRVISPAFFFLPYLNFRVFTWLHKWPFIGQGPPALILRWCLEHWIVFCGYGGNPTGVLVLRWKLELCSEFSNKSFIKEKEKKTGKTANMLSLSHCLCSPPPAPSVRDPEFLTGSVPSQRIQTASVRRWSLWTWCCSSVSSSGTTSSPTTPTCARSSPGETCLPRPPRARARPQGRIRRSTTRRSTTRGRRYGPGEGHPRVWAALGAAVSRGTCRREGDAFPVVASCFKAHLSLLLTDTQSLDYNSYLLEFSFGYAEIEKIR